MKENPKQITGGKQGTTIADLMQMQHPCILPDGTVKERGPQPVTPEQAAAVDALPVRGLGDSY